MIKFENYELLAFQKKNKDFRGKNENVHEIRKNRADPCEIYEQNLTAQHVTSRQIWIMKCKSECTARCNTFRFNTLRNGLVLNYFFSKWRTKVFMHELTNNLKICSVIKNEESFFFTSKVLPFLLQKSFDFAEKFFTQQTLEKLQCFK